jgi:hypothetical protein
LVIVTFAKEQFVKTPNKVLQTLIAATMLVGVSGSVHAAKYTTWFQNETTTNAIYLWLTDESVSIADITPKQFKAGTSMSGWDWTGTLDSVVIFGPTAAAGSGQVQLRFDYTAPFAFEWAEVFWSGPTIDLLASGTLAYNRGSWSSSASFTHVGDMPSPYASPVPIPNSLLMLLSAMCCAALCRRRGHLPENG